MGSRGEERGRKEHLEGGSGVNVGWGEVQLGGIIYLDLLPDLSKLRQVFEHCCG